MKAWQSEGAGAAFATTLVVVGVDRWAARRPVAEWLRAVGVEA